MAKKKKPKSIDPVAAAANKWGKKDLIERGDLTFDDIRNAMFETMGNITQAAKLLGRHRDRLSYYFKKYPELENARKEAIELRREDLRETALGALLELATTPLMVEVLHRETNQKIKVPNELAGLAGAKHKASETLLKYTGDLVEKSEVKSTNLNVEKNLNHLSDEELDKKLKELEMIESNAKQGN